MTNEECREVFAALSAYLDAELPEDLCERMEAHMRGCAPCVAFVNSLRRSVRLCRELETSETAGPLKEEARAELEAAYRAWRERVG